jgi:hypothetical protein
MQCACVILSSVACPAVHDFTTLSYVRQDFREKKLHTKYVFRFSPKIWYEKFLILRIELDMMKNVNCFSYKGPPFLSDCILTLIFSTIFEISLKIKFHENPSNGSRVPCGRTGRRTNMTDLIVGFRNFVNVPKMAPLEVTTV